MEPIELNAGVFKSLRPALIVKEGLRQVVGIDFSCDGTLLYVADSSSLNVYSTTTGQSYRKLFMKTHEIEQISHTHHNLAVLVATKKNNLILYWSIHENKVIKMFKGHTASIASLSLSPKDDSFISTSFDNTMRIWDIGSEGQDCKFLLNLQAESISAFPVANYDPLGVAFGVAWSQQQRDKQVVRICLYDKKHCQDEPFHDWRKDYNQIKLMRFSPDGELLVLATSDNNLILLNAFQGDQIRRFNSFVNESSLIECSFTPDSRFLLSGSQNGTVHSWNIDGRECAQLKVHVEKVNCVKFSPAHCLLVSAGCNIIFWLPERKLN